MELLPGGATKAVTNDNKAHYVALLSRSFVVQGADDCIKAFQKVATHNTVVPSCLYWLAAFHSLHSLSQRTGLL